MKHNKKLATLIICMSCGLPLAANNHNDPFDDLFNELNQIMDSLHNQRRVSMLRRQVSQQQPRRRTNITLFNHPFFNDPFFNDPFFNNDPTIRRLLARLGDDDNTSIYIFKTDDDDEQNGENQNQQPQQQPKQQKPRAAQQQPKKRRRVQQQPQSIHSMFPFFGGGMHGGMGNQHGGMFGGPQRPQYSQYDPDQETKKVTFKDVLGLEEVKQEVSEVVEFLKNPERFHKFGAEIPRGILLEGPPGCGKTLLARAVAGEAGCTFINASGSSFINKYVGVGADNIRKLFDQAKASDGPTIIFIDEIDSIANRERKDTGGNSEHHQTMNELLNQLDGFEGRENIIVMAATNFAKSLDKALTRPGRFDRIIHVGLPTKKGREAILNYYITKKINDILDPSLSPEGLAKEYASRTTQFSGAQLKQLVNEWALTACRRTDAETITSKDCEEGYDKVTLGLRTNIARTPEQLKRTAYHEAGHALVKILTDQPVAKMTILSRGDALGATFEKEKYETLSEYTKEELAAKVKSLQGGYLAEDIALNVDRPGKSSDIEHVLNIASAMIKDFGMGTNELRGLKFSNGMSDIWKSKYDDQISDLVQSSEKDARALLTKHKNTLDKLAKELLDKETLTEDAIYKIAGKAKSA